MRDDAGAVVAGALVTMRAANVGRTPERRVSTAWTVTDEAGHFVLWLDTPERCDACAAALEGCVEGSPRGPAFEGEVVLEIQGNARGFASVTAPHAATTAPIEIRLPPVTGRIDGRLVGADGRPFLRARILIRSVDTPEDRRSTLVDPSGYFSVRGLSDGAYLVSAVKDGQRLVDARTVDAGAGPRVELSAPFPGEGFELVVQVLSEGRPAVGTEVTGGPFGRARTDAEGIVRAVGVIPGNYRLQFDPEPVAPDQVPPVDLVPLRGDWTVDESTSPLRVELEAL